MSAGVSSQWFKPTMMMRSSAKSTDLNSELNSQHTGRDGHLKVITMQPDNRLAHEPVSTGQPVMIMVTLVICLHAGLLFLALHSSSEQQTTVTVPTIAGVLIQAPSTEVVKAPKKKPTPAPTPKHIPAPKKAITLPPVKKKPVAPEVQQTIDVVEESVDVEQQATPIVAPRVDATRRSNPAPVYPRGSLRRHEQGKVILQVLILADGSVGEVRIKQSSGFKRLDRSAIKAVKRWRYIPAQQGEQAIEYWYQQPIVFSLRK